MLWILSWYSRRQRIHRKTPSTSFWKRQAIFIYGLESKKGTSLWRKQRKKQVYRICFRDLAKLGKQLFIRRDYTQHCWFVPTLYQFFSQDSMHISWNNSDEVIRLCKNGLIRKRAQFRSPNLGFFLDNYKYLPSEDQWKWNPTLEI